MLTDEAFLFSNEASLESESGLSVPTALMASAAVGYAAGLATLLAKHQWILKADGRPVFCDFLAYWAAGRMALAGRAAAAYDTNALHAVQTAGTGPTSDYLYWNYPPFFLFVAIALASAPYVAAFLGWVISTAAAYAAAIGAIANRRAAALAACASPVILLTSFSGQNGFLTAALFGGSLVLLPTSPVLGGALIGLLAYKPQFGLLIPLALLLGRNWRALCGAVATVIVLVGLSAIAFGTGAWSSFLNALPVISNTDLTLGGEGWVKGQSLYSFIRFCGGGDSLAWLFQILVCLVAAAAVIWSWSSQSVAYPLKASILVTATLLSTPYLHVYDFPVLIVGLALLYRHRSFDIWEWGGVVTINLLMLGFLAQLAPLGTAISLLTATIIARRIIVTRSLGSRSLRPGIPL